MEQEKLNIPFEEIEKAFIEVVDKAIAEKRHIFDDEVTLATKVDDASVVLFLYKEEYEEGDCFREKAMFQFYMDMLQEYEIAEWRSVLFKALQCLRACPEVYAEEYISYHNAAKICYKAAGDNQRAQRHFYCQLMNKAAIADEEYLMELIEKNSNRPDQHKTLLLAIFYYALLTESTMNNEDYGWTRERYALIEMALKEATTCYAENDECDLLQRALIYLCRDIYYRKTRRIKLSETAEERLYELLETLRPQGIHEENFYSTAISTITDEIGEVLIEPFLIAVENTFADLRDEEEEIDEDDSISPEDFNQWLKKAEQGDAEAQYNLGVCYHNGLGTEEDCDKSIYWYQKAAEQGTIEAMFNLGLHYHKKVNYELAVYWYGLAVDGGNISAMTNLGYCLENGLGTKLDMKKAVQLYRKAAEQGFDCAQFNLAECYEQGKGVKQDINQAIHWYTLSAEQGYENAKEALERLAYND